MSTVATIINSTTGTVISANFVSCITVGSQIINTASGGSVADGNYYFSAKPTEYVNAVGSYVSSLSYGWRYKVDGNSLGAYMYSKNSPTMSTAETAFSTPSVSVYDLVPVGTYIKYDDTYKMVIALSAGNVTNYISSPWIEATADFVSSTSLEQSDRNDKIGLKYTVGGVGPFRAETTSGLSYPDLGYGPDIQFDIERYDSNSAKSATIYDANDNSTDDPICNVQWTADETAYSNYTFGSDGIIDITPSFKSYTLAATPTYRIIDKETYEPLTSYTSTPLFAGIPLKDVRLQVKETDIQYGGNSYIDIDYTITDQMSNIKDLGAVSLTNDPMVVAWNSEIKASDEMRYRFNMYDTNLNLILKANVYPDIDSNYYGIYDMSMVYNSLVTTTPTYDVLGVIPKDDIYSFKYGVNSSLVGDASTSVTKYCIKGGTQYGNDIDITEYYNTPYVGTKFMQAWENERYLRYDDYATLNFMNGTFDGNDVEDEFTHIVFVEYTGPNQSNTPVHFMPLEINSLNYSDKMVAVGVGPQNFQDALDLGIITDFQLITETSNFMKNANVIGYNVALCTIYQQELDGEIYYNPTPKTEFLRIDINKDEDCTRYEPTRFIWLDMLGNYSTFTYNGINAKTYNISKNVINTNYYKFKDSDWTYEIGDRGLSNNDIFKTESHQAFSGFLYDNISSNLMDLYSSSDVYIIKSDGLYPVVITSNNIEEKTIKKNRLFNHKIKYQMAYDINTND